MNKLSTSVWFRWIAFAGVLLLDQATKHWARARFSLPSGGPDYYQSIRVAGEWIQFRLVYNTGAAFGTRPQNVLPFLQPTVFYALFSLAAILFLALYYRRGARDAGSRMGVLLILAGALGNLLDRLALHKVTDFIDVGLPDVYPRWPVFNVADSSVCVGIVVLLVAPLLARSRRASGASRG